MEGNKKTIVAHSGKFHSDDILAVASLLLLLGEENVNVVRSRDDLVVESGDYVVDVGGVYDPKRNRFDHHQEGGAGTRENGIPYASFGLVWKEYGEKICGNIEISKKIDELLVQPVDATDNGVQIVEPKFPGIYPYDIGLYFNTFMPSWDEAESFDSGFFGAVTVAKHLIESEINKRKKLIADRVIVEEVYKTTEDKRIIVLDRHYSVSETLSKYPEPIFVVSPREDGNWNAKGVSDDPNSFERRKYFPESWGAKRGEDLEKASGVLGAIFCHRDCYLVVNKTKEGAIKMAEIALES